ncbi:hypothetical protein KC331_g8253 [Hortaea werneckii]|nr:hypothetical protein KC331_g8253 [Hortaea werneckii]KAI7712669.1 hypothetical protein KC353_g8103 [Hortaea werneckii]
METESSEMLGMEGDMNIPELHNAISNREKAMRETVGDGKALRNSRDPGLGGLNGFLSDWNLEEMTSTPNFFLDRLKFRVENDLHRQLFEVPNWTPGDRQLALTSAMRMRASAPKDKLSEMQVFALGDLAMIVNFLHSLSSCLAMASRSTKAGVFFTGRVDKLNEELSQYKAEADFGDHLVLMDSILKPRAASHALKALDDYMVERSGAGMGSLYDGVLDECLEDIEQKYADAKSYLQKDMKTNVPSPTGEKASTSFRAQERREKAKTRPADASTHEITPLASQEPETPSTPSSHVRVKASAASVFDTLFTNSESRGSVSWTEFVAAMAELGFSVTPKGGSIFTFDPPETMVASSKTLHRPHASDIEGWKLLWIARRLRKKYGWNAETFEVV